MPYLGREYFPHRPGEQDVLYSHDGTRAQRYLAYATASHARCNVTVGTPYSWCNTHWIPLWGFVAVKAVKSKEAK
jgi:hypothetical protein